MGKEFTVIAAPFPGTSDDRSDLAIRLHMTVGQRERAKTGSWLPAWQIDQVIGPEDGWVWFVLSR